MLDVFDARPTPPPNISDSKSRRPAALPLRRAEISHRSIGHSAGCKPILLGRLQLYFCLAALCDPPVARASRCRWALQPISLLGTNPAGRLTRTRWVSYWQPLPDKPIPYQREPFLPRAPGKSCSKAWIAFERFSPLIRGARCRSALEPGSLYPTSLYPQEKTALGPGRPRVPAAGNGQPLPQINTGSG